MLGQTFGPQDEWPRHDLIGYSDEFDAGLALEAYRCGVFPMPLAPVEMGWWSPMQRGLLPVAGIRVTKSLRQSARHYVTTIDQAFTQVIEACGDPSRPDGWIDRRIISAFQELHRAGWAHSVEVWNQAGQLVGGLYGIHTGGLFAGESMFHDRYLGKDASKVALMRLSLELSSLGVELLDVQWLTEHLGSLGAYEVPREVYLEKLDGALQLPTRPWLNRAAMSGQELIDSWRLSNARTT